MAAPYPRALRLFPSLRQSLLAKFADCQLSAGFELRLSIAHGPDSEGLHRSGWTSHRAGAGRLIHEAIARGLAHMVEHGEERIAPEQLLDFYDDALSQRDRPLPQTFALPAHEDALARRTLKKWARDNAITIEDVYGVEERLAFTVTYPNGRGGVVTRTLTGQLDLLLISDGGTGEHATVPDWKDTWKLPPERKYDPEAEEDDDEEDDKLSAEGYFQQRFYALAIFLLFPRIQSVTLREFYVRRSIPREATIWRHEVPDLLRYFSAQAEKFDRAVHAAYEPAKGRRKRRKPLTTTAQWGEPSPGAHCSYCPLSAECPLEPDAREYGAISSPEQAERATGELLVARRVVKQISRSLDTWLDKHGPTRVKDAKRERYFGHVEATRVRRPSKAEVRRAMLAGRSPLDLFREQTHTRMAEFSPDEDVTAGLDDDDVVAMFERAAEQAKRKRGRRAA